MESLGILLAKLASLKPGERLTDQEIVEMQVQADLANQAGPIADILDSATGTITDLRVGNIRIGPYGILAGRDIPGRSFSGMRISNGVPISASTGSANNDPSTIILGGYLDDLLQWGVTTAGSIIAGGGAVTLANGGLSIEAAATGSSQRGIGVRRTKSISFSSPGTV